MAPRWLWIAFSVLTLAGCADAPGQPKMLPLDYNEQTRAEGSYKRVEPEMRQIDGVVGTYLSSNNNPRKIVVIISKDSAAATVAQRYPNGVDGLRVETQKQFSDQDPAERGAIQAVPTVEAPKGWWNQFLFFLQHAPATFWGKKPG